MNEDHVVIEEKAIEDSQGKHQKERDIESNNATACPVSVLGFVVLVEAEPVAVFEVL